MSKINKINVYVSHKITIQLTVELPLTLPMAKFILIDYQLLFNFVVDCGRPPDLANGHFTRNGTFLGDTATYTCDTGYTLVGNATRICQNDGTWSDLSAVCQCMKIFHFNYFA